MLGPSNRLNVRINEGRVRQLALTLGKLPLADDFAAQMTPAMEVSDETAFRAYLWAAAICHSTRGALTGHRGDRYYKGWDFLLRSFTHQAQCDERGLGPEAVAIMTASRLRDILSSGSADAQLGLGDLPRRAEILRATARELSESFDGCVSRLLNEADRRVGGESGAYAQLARLTAFTDPLRKKSSAFLMTVHFSGRWPIVDHANVLPMIDYHRMRLLMRTGCIEVTDERIADRLRAEMPVSGHMEAAIRDAAMTVCTTIPRLAGMAMFDFDVLLWAHARSCCRRAPMCVSRTVESDSFYSYLAESPSKQCVFEAWCPGATNAEVRSLWEPIVSTEYY